VWFIFLVQCLGAGFALAQQVNLESAAPASLPEAPLQLTSPQLSLRLTEDMQAGAWDDVFVKKNLRISGPLVRPFKANKIRDFPRRLASLFNPFARGSSEGQTEGVVAVSARAWTTIAGWNPGKSAWPDDTHHEAQLRLISVSAERQP